MLHSPVSPMNCSLRIWQFDRVCTGCYSVYIFWTHFSMVKPCCSNFRMITANFSGVRIFRRFMVYNKFHFSDIHQRMNTMGRVQSLTSLNLHTTYCIHKQRLTFGGETAGAFSMKKLLNEWTSFSFFFSWKWKEQAFLANHHFPSCGMC